MSEINFKVCPTPEDLDYNLQSKIAFVTGVRPSQIDPQDIAALLDRQVTRHSIGKYVLLQAIEQLHTLSEREANERLQSFCQLGEALLHQEATYSSYGIHLPSYMTALERYQGITAKKPTTSLLVGALTPDTVVEYAVTTRHVFPDITVHVMDTKGVATRTACDATGAVFRKGTALHMPYDPHTVDIVQTHYLLDQIEDESYPDSAYHAKKRRFLQEAHATLTSGGLLLMVEPVFPRQIVDDMQCSTGGIISQTEAVHLAGMHQKLLKSDLYQAGFDQVAITPAPGFHFRRDLEYLLLTNTWDISSDALQLNHPSVLIAAFA